MLECESAKLNSVQDSLKSRNQLHVSHSDVEVRVNDYKPLLLILWKANIDTQFVAESSLHYVSGYVTKAERSSMQRNLARS